LLKRRNGVGGEERLNRGGEGYWCNGFGWSSGGAFYSCDGVGRSIRTTAYDCENTNDGKREKERGEKAGEERIAENECPKSSLGLGNEFLNVHRRSQTLIDVYRRSQILTDARIQQYFPVR
jgi:hypothetical protein